MSYSGNIRIEQKEEDETNVDPVIIRARSGACQRLEQQVDRKWRKVVHVDGLMPKLMVTMAAPALGMRSARLTHGCCTQDMPRVLAQALQRVAKWRMR